MHQLFLNPSLEPTHSTLEQVRSILTHMAADVLNTKLPALSIVLDANEWERSRVVASKLSTFETIFVFGTGGSSLGGQALCQLNTNACVKFVDNIDPRVFDQLLASCDFEKTGAIFISKSGETLETLAQAYVITDHFSQALGPSALPHHLFVLSQNNPSPLRALCEKHSLPFWELDPLIGGRFCVFSIVGLLPGILSGVDIPSFCQGARSVLLQLLEHDFESFAQSIAWQYNLLNQGINQQVLFGYSDALFTFSQWACQLIGESLGKNGKGITPIAARGTVDQHSQLQLYIDGPRDKWITFITCADKGLGPKLSSPSMDPSLSYLLTKTMGDVMAAEHQATLMSMAQSGCYVRQMQIGHPSPHALGELMMHFMIEVIGLAAMMNVNPFDQPAVEQGKILTKQLLEHDHSTPSIHTG
jgi:glucose-6-phosphate isomerase